ncbi:hypothetical protein Ate01nite_35850 [Actinoplanes teichomyceticus]|nr:hypothetical protein Ate01nite_35850 [Actinoplanes teichomyceticus]
MAEAVMWGSSDMRPMFSVFDRCAVGDMPWGGGGGAGSSVCDPAGAGGHQAAVARRMPWASVMLSRVVMVLRAAIWAA